MAIHNDHRQRVYSRFLREGLENFEEHNAMEFLLFLTRVRGDTNPLAHELINRFGSVAEVLDAPVEELIKVPGISHTSAVVLKFIPQMCAYYLNSKRVHKKVVLKDPETVSEIFFPKFAARTTEALYIALVNDRRELLCLTRLSEGNYNATAFPMDKLLKEMTHPGATGLFLAHNHPHGLPMPSFEDIAMTRKVYHISREVHVTLIDHLIFSDSEYVSMEARGFMRQIAESEQALEQNLAGLP